MSSVAAAGADSLKLMAWKDEFEGSNIIMKPPLMGESEMYYHSNKNISIGTDRETQCFFPLQSSRSAGGSAFKGHFSHGHT